MNERMILAGSGGQGLLTAGRLLVQCAMAEGREVTYFPAYGTEVRGGTAHCHVVISDEEIFSPLVEEATALMVMNKPSLERFGPRLVRGGLLVVNSSMAPAPVMKGRRVLGVGAGEIAREIGDVRVANMVMVGALNRVLGLVGRERILEAITRNLKGAKAGMIPLNERALARGEALADQWKSGIGQVKSEK